MNVYDSARMADVLAPLGYRETASPEDADLVILNTCHIREKATEKVYSEIGRLRRIKTQRRDRGGDMFIAVGGCVGQAEGAEIIRRAPVVDAVFGPQTYHRLPEIVARATRRAAGSAGTVDTEFPVEPKFDHLPPPGGRGSSAFLSVQEGCDKFCTFCVVPYTRGAEYSRPVAAIRAEAEAMVDAGAREITLLGQNVNAYHGLAPDGREWGLGRLLFHLAEIGGLARLRYTTSHPRDMDDALFAAHRDLEQLMPYLHLPVQSGADRVLSAMNRGYSADDYRRCVDRLRAARPEIALATDLIVGFPGETDADAGATLELVREIGFAQAYSFKYSRRPGTPGASMRHQVGEDVKSARLLELQTLLNEQQAAYNAATVGLVLPVLFDRPGRQPGQWVGRTPFMQAVHVVAPGSLEGALVDIRIDTAGPNSLSGSLAGPTGTVSVSGEQGVRA